MNIEYLLTKYNRLAHDPILGIITLYVNLIERLLCANSFYILIDFHIYEIQVWMTFMFCSQAEQRTFGKSLLKNVQFLKNK